MKLGILITTSPEHQNTYTIMRLCEAFLEKRHEVEIFLMDDGVYNAIKNSARHRLYTGMEELINKGARLSLCTLTAEMRGLNEEDFIEGVVMGSQYDFSRIVSGADRFLTFT